MKPGQTDTLEKASESGDYGSWFRGCLLPCGDVGRWPPFTLWTSGFDLHLHPSCHHGPCISTAALHKTLAGTHLFVQIL